MSLHGKVSDISIEQFRDIVMHSFYNRPRETMPWREHPTPYHVLVSECMLQQTQVSRVLSYFMSFVDKWSTVEALALAPLSAVLKEWQGLGYNRRARFLHNCAKLVLSDHNGVIPDSKETLQLLPGIGEYTSSAIMVFAFNIPCVVIETNIRRAIIHTFFSQQDEVQEHDVRYYVENTMDTANPRLWYWALMDYGYWLKFEVSNPNRKSNIYKKQSMFEGSKRQIRGAIVRILAKHGMLNEDDLYHYLFQDLVYKRNIENKEQFINEAEECLACLEKEGLLVSEKKQWYLAH